MSDQSQHDLPATLDRIEQALGALTTIGEDLIELLKRIETRLERIEKRLDR